MPLLRDLWFAHLIHAKLKHNK